MGIINPLLIIAITPLFNSFIYPLFNKCGLLRTALQKIGAGGFLIGIAFVISGFVELKLEVCHECHTIWITYLSSSFSQTPQTTYPVIPAAGSTQFNFINTLPCPVNISHGHTGQQPANWMTVDANSFTFVRDLKNEPIQVQAHLLNPFCANLNLSTAEWSGTIEGTSTKVTLRHLCCHNLCINVSLQTRHFPLWSLVETANSKSRVWKRKNR